jgi:hypothetical protein
MYTIDGIILCFFFIAFRCPDGVDKKQLPAILRICPKEYTTANTATSNSEKTKTSETINDMMLPIAAQAIHPIILVLYDISAQGDLSSSPKENIPFSSGFF